MAFPQRLYYYLKGYIEFPVISEDLSNGQKGCQIPCSVILVCLTLICKFSSVCGDWSSFTFVQAVTGTGRYIENRLTECPVHGWHRWRSGAPFAKVQVECGMLFWESYLFYLDTSK